MLNSRNSRSVCVRMVCSKVPFSSTDRRYRLTVRAEVPIT